MGDRSEDSESFELTKLGDRQLTFEDVRARISQLPGPDVPVFIQFENIGYTIKVKTRTALGTEQTVNRTLIQGVSGKVRPGEFLAIMGPTGAGKTTLLSILSGRYSQNVEGSILINGAAPGKDYKRQNAYVMQNDVLFPNLTIEQTLRYQAMMRLGHLSSQDQQNKVEEMIDILNLNKSKNTFIGGPLRRGVSGGERKRVNIGNELLTNPSLIILDEPTTGLDTSTALNILQMLKGMADSGYTVIAAIHQPSSQMFALFDSLMVLVEGQPIYYGKADKALDYFDEIGLKCEEFFNPADFMMGLIMQEEVSKSSGFSMKQDLVDSWSAFSSTHSLAPSKIISKQDKQVYANCIAATEKMGTPSYSTTFFQQIYVLLQRSFFQEKGNRLEVQDFIQHLVLSVVIGLIWFQTPFAEANINDRFGALFFILVYNMFQSVFASVFTFPLEKAVIARERNSGSYRVSAFYLAKTISVLPFLFLYPTLVTIITYFLVGLKTEAGAFFYFLTVVYLSAFSAEGLGICISAAVAPDLRKALTAITVATLTFMLLGGFYIREYPLWLAWMPWLSFIYPAVSGALCFEFQGTLWRFTPNSTSPFLSAAINDTNSTDADFFSGDAILLTQKLPFYEPGYWLLVLLGWALFYRVVGFFIMQQSLKNKL